MAKNISAELINEWHPQNPKSLESFTIGSHYKAWWKCSQCEHEWQAQVTNRIVRESGCPECYKKRMRGKQNRNWLGHQEISSKQWKSIQRDAKRRSLELTVTIEEVWELFISQDRECALSGRLLTMRGNYNGKYAGNASLDRIDSVPGYIPGNLQWIDKEFQKMKMNLPDEKFIGMCTEVATKNKRARIH